MAVVVDMIANNELNNDGKSDQNEDDAEELDPRIKCELDCLNAAADGINHLETEYGEAQALFQQMMQDATFHLKVSHSKLGKSVDKSRSYYDALKAAKFSHNELHQAALRFEQAQSRHFNAKKRVAEAERIAFSSANRKLDPALQEMLNQATVEVMEAAKQSKEAWEVHRNASVEFEGKNKIVYDISKSLKKQIIKSRPYFDLKIRLNKQLEIQKKRVEKVQEGIQHSKNEYEKTLHNLELISNEIHRVRDEKNKMIEPRGEGVGADSDHDEIVSIKNVDFSNQDLFTKSVSSCSDSEENITAILSSDLDFCTKLPKHKSSELSDLESATEKTKECSQSSKCKEFFKSSRQSSSKSRRKSVSLTDLTLDVSKAFRESCTDLTYDMITSHSIPFSPPQLDFVDTARKDYLTISEFVYKSHSFPEMTPPRPRRRAVTMTADSFTKRVLFKSHSTE